MKTLTGPLKNVSADARTYPVHLLRQGETGLCLFAAAFLGRNDAIHMARMNMTVTCVDIDEHRLMEMWKAYPDTWTFRHSDAWEFAELARAGRGQWDVVSVDTFTGSIVEQSMASLSLWCSLARRVVTATVTAGVSYTIPRGWEYHIHERSELADWLVLTR